MGLNSRICKQRLVCQCVEEGQQVFFLGVAEFKTDNKSALIWVFGSVSGIGSVFNEAPTGRVKALMRSSKVSTDPSCGYGAVTAIFRSVGALNLPRCSFSREVENPLAYRVASTSIHVVHPVIVEWLLCER